jgi:hypothetical protein
VIPVENDPELKRPLMQLLTSRTEAPEQKSDRWPKIQTFTESNAPQNNRGYKNTNENNDFSNIRTPAKSATLPLNSTANNYSFASKQPAPNAIETKNLNIKETSPTVAKAPVAPAPPKLNIETKNVVIQEYSPTNATAPIVPSPPDLNNLDSTFTINRPVEDKNVKEEQAIDIDEEADVVTTAQMKKMVRSYSMEKVKQIVRSPVIVWALWISLFFFAAAVTGVCLFFFYFCEFCCETFLLYNQLI